MVYDCKDCILPVLEGESCDQIHCYLLEGSCILWDCYSVEQGFPLVCDDFILLANGTSFNIFCDPSVHS